MRALACSMVCAATFPACVHPGHGQAIYSLEAARTGATPEVSIRWRSEPLDKYDVKVTGSLAAPAWSNAAPGPVAASNLTAAWTGTATSAITFPTSRRLWRPNRSGTI